PAPNVLTTLSLHDALPIYSNDGVVICHQGCENQTNDCQRENGGTRSARDGAAFRCRSLLFGEPISSDKYKQTSEEICRRTKIVVDRKSTRLNSSHEWISYA